MELMIFINSKLQSLFQKALTMDKQLHQTSINDYNAPYKITSKILNSIKNLDILEIVAND